MSNKKLTSEVIHKLKQHSLSRLLKDLNILTSISNGFKTGAQYEHLIQNKGICAHIGTFTVGLLVPFWTGYSGNKVYPVKHKDFNDPEAAYDSTHLKWKGDYGRSRIRLLRFIIKCLTQIVEEMQNEITDSKEAV